MKLRSIIKTNLKNIQGKRLNKKFLALECDDWGGIRIPSDKVKEKLLKERLPLEKSRFLNDTLESAEDLSLLFEVLMSVKDMNGRNAVMTPVTNMANPDFTKIKQSGYTEYHYEDFTATLLRYGRGHHVFNLWKQGIEAGIFVPELHGREHISVQIWLQKLREGNRDLLAAFDSGVVSIDIPDVHPLATGFRSEFFFDSESEIPFLKNSIRDAVKIFLELFGFQPSVFVPSNAVFHPVLENEVFSAGIKYLYVNRLMKYSVNNNSIIKHYVSGQKSPEGLVYYTRNCAFEPSEPSYKGIEYTLMQIAAAFRWGKPAIISTHRVNFVGGIDTRNREKGISELGKLLKTIIKKWPEVEFLPSAKVLEEYTKN